MTPRLDREVTIERQQTTQDATYGTDVVTWVALSYLPGSPLVAERFPAEVQDVMPSRDEAVQQGLKIGRSQTRCRIRWRDDIDSSMRVTIHGDTDRVYQIIGGPSEVFGRRQYLEMMLERTTS